MDEFFKQRAAMDALRLEAARVRQIAEAESWIRVSPEDPQAYVNAARRHKQHGLLYEALGILMKGIRRCAPSPVLYEYMVERLEKCNRTDKALDMAREAARLFPHDLIFPLREALMLPVLYDSAEQLERYRQRFSAGLDRLIGQTPLNDLEDGRRALAAISKSVNKYLAYQGRNDRTLQMQYGAWLHRILSLNFPQYVQPLASRSVPRSTRTRVGYLSARFRNVSVTKAFYGWLQQHDPGRVDTFAYYVGRGVDHMTEQVRKSCEHFRHPAAMVAEIAAAVLADELDVLVFLDVGMQPLMNQLAALRLAPVQCAAWDHPVTTGLPTIDYFLSSDLTELPNAQDHYSEQLIRLPGVGLCYAKPVIARSPLTKTRSDFGLRDDAVLYVSPQTVFKYLPDQDAVFAEIARKVPNSQFVFLVTNEVVRDDFKDRLGRSFDAVGLSLRDHCVLLAELPELDYWNLCMISDVILDTNAWSGGVSTFELLACGVPVVTLPGEQMRARQSAAILQQAGAVETIAGSNAEYVEIAARLGRDVGWRRAVVDAIASGYSSLYSDTRSVKALEAFYASVR